MIGEEQKKEAYDGEASLGIIATNLDFDYHCACWTIWVCTDSDF